MKRLSSTALLSVVLVTFIAGLAGEAAWLRREQQKAARAQTSLRRKIQERDKLLTQAPALNAANEQALADDLVRVRRTLAEERAALQFDDAGRPGDATSTKPTEAFFELARFVERSRAAADAAKVALRPDERFGFAAYANEGPAADVIAQVHRQRLVGESVVECLLAARPRALRALHREAVGSVLPGARSQGEDYFTMDRALLVRRPGDIDSLAFRVEFNGQTATLRDFLTGLANLPRPLIVRSVEAEPLTAAASMPGPAGPPGLLVGRNFSKFTVVIESVFPASVPAKAVP